MGLRQGPEPQRVKDSSSAAAAVVHSESQRGRDTPNSSPLPVMVLETPAQAQSTALRDAKADRHDAEDLDAQVRAADAAERQISPAWAAAFLSFVGTILISITLAVSLLDLKHAREATRQSLRAYVYVDGGKVVWYNEGVRATLKIRNGGTTPARCFSLSGVVEYRQLTDDLTPPPFDAVTAKTWSALGGGSDLTAPLSGDGIMLEGLDMDGGNQLSFRGIVRYVTIFDEEMETEFSLALRARKGRMLHDVLQHTPGRRTVFSPTGATTMPNKA